MCYGGKNLIGVIAPLIFKRRSRQMSVVRLSALATLLPEKKLELEAVWVLELVRMFWKRDLKKRCSRVYPGHFPDYAASYWFEDNTKVCICKLKFEFWIDLIHYWNFWKASVNVILYKKLPFTEFLVENHV